MKQRYQITIAKEDTAALSRALTEFGIYVGLSRTTQGNELVVVVSLSKYELLYVKLAVRIKDLVPLDETVLYFGSKLQG